MQVGSNVGAAFPAHRPRETRLDNRTAGRHQAIDRRRGGSNSCGDTQEIKKNITENTFKKPVGMSSRFGSRIPKWAPNWQKPALDLRVRAPPGYDFGLPIRQINEEIAVIEAGLERLPKLTRMAERIRTPDHSRVRAFNGLTKSPTSQPGDRK
jgi:hypothetical protein